tara:strand:- start:385 stop:1734 length:1350 start_codon:yes stop_codon:yes gene_type:complete
MANSALNRTLGTPTNADKWTWSAWIKRSKLSSSGVYMDVFAAYTDANNYAQISFHPDNYLFYYDQQGGAIKASLSTNRLFRDTSAWYHIMLATDTTQSTAADRIKLYINGTQYTWDRATTHPSQNQDTMINKASTPHYVGQVGIGNFFDGYMSHVAFVDGQQLAPTSFGETDSTSGIWKFKPPSGVTWGTNGAHFKFENSGNLGLDSSTNTNNWTVAGNLKQALDTPSDSYATFNPLNGVHYAGLGFTNANSSMTTTAGQYAPGLSSIGVNSGKWYAEFKMTSSSNWAMVGVTGQFATATSYSIGHGTTGYGYTGGSSASGQQSNNNNLSSYGDTYNNGDIIGIALDLDNHKLYFHKNGTYQNSGVPTSGSTGTGAISISTSPATGFYHMGAGNYSGSQTPSWSVNFGNGFFGTTAISSAGSNGNGSLFEYDVPSGYYALNTKNINTYG